jgi:hypothetical protein
MLQAAKPNEDGIKLQNSEKIIHSFVIWQIPDSNDQLAELSK